MSRGPKAGAKRGKYHFKRDQARQALVAAGIELLAEKGPATGMGRITLPMAIEKTGVPRPSAYRAFSEDQQPQESFRNAVIVELITRMADDDQARMNDAAVDALSRGIERRDEADAREMAEIYRELVRVSANAVATAKYEIQDVGYFTAVASAIDSRTDPLVTGAITNAAEKFNREYAEMYTEAASLFGLRLKDVWTYPSLAASVAQLAVGNAMLRNVSPGFTDIELATGVDGEKQPWSTLALAIFALMRSAFEADPRVRNAADLTTLALP